MSEKRNIPMPWLADNSGVQLNYAMINPPEPNFVKCANQESRVFPYVNA